MSKIPNRKKSLVNQRDFKLSDEQIKFLNDEREMHLSGQSKSYSREEATQIIKGQNS